MNLSDIGIDMKKIAYSLLTFLFLLTSHAHADVIDMLFVYDNSAREWVDANGGMTAFSFEAVNKLNQSARNSGLDLQFRCVKYMHVDHDYGGSMHDTLRAVRNGDGVLASVHEARDANGADLVAMFVDTGSAFGTTGTSYLLTSWYGYADVGYSLCAVRAVAVSDTLTHEVGHNLGADHSKYQTASPGPNEYLDDEYSAGWYFTGLDDGGLYHTVMAYNNDGHGNSYSPTGLFSSPLLGYKGTAAGDAADGDNCRLIMQTKSVVANYRATKMNIVIPPIHLLLVP